MVGRVEALALLKVQGFCMMAIGYLRDMQAFRGAGYLP
jgi:hypothetical protein